MMQANQSSSKSTFVKIINSPEDQLERAKAMLFKISEATSVDFYLVLASTEISDLENISAAGADAKARRLTPKLDAEALLSGSTALGEQLPASPVGVTSPVIITRACLSLFEQHTTVIDCGSFVAPQIKHQTSGTTPGKNIALQNALPLNQVKALFEKGQKSARLRAEKIKNGDIKGEPIAVLAECVPGGTTTALALLKGLGYNASGYISGSLPCGQKQAKEALAAQAEARLIRDLGTAGLETMTLEDPLLAVSCLGDPMQAFAAGFVIGTLKSMNEPKSQLTQPLILAGGCQMLAVYALVRALAAAETITNFDSGHKLYERIKKSLIVITTKWVAYDKNANTKELAEIIDAPCAAASPDFYKSKHAGLRAYEDGHVKEGVGAGAAMLLAELFGQGHDTIIDTIDLFYEKMILTAPVKSWTYEI